MSDSEERFGPGDVVYLEGASAILGDVLEVEQVEEIQHVTVAWRATTTSEMDFDLRKQPRPLRLAKPTDESARRLDILDWPLQDVIAETLEERELGAAGDVEDWLAGLDPDRLYELVVAPMIDKAEQLWKARPT